MKQNSPVTETDKSQLVDKLITISFLHGIGSSGGIGYHIKKLTEKERDITKKLKSKDFYHWIN